MAANAVEGRLDITHKMNESFVNDFPIANVDVNGQPVDIGDPQTLFDGDAYTTPEGNPWGYAIPTSFTPQLVGGIQPIADPTCVADTVRIGITATFTNQGPAAGVWNIGNAQIVNHNITEDANGDGVVDDADKVVHTQGFGASGSNYPIGAEVPLNLSYDAPLADLQAGALDVALAIELNHNGPKAWEITDFNPTYDVLCAAETTPATAYTPPQTPATIDLNDHITTDGEATVDWPSTVLLDAIGEPAGTTLDIPEVGTYELDTTTGIVTFTPADGFAGDAPAVTYRSSDSNGQPIEGTFQVTVGAAPTVEEVTENTTFNTPVTLNPLEGVETDGVATVDGDSIRLIDGEGNLVTELDTDEGRFELNTDTGEITFTPADGFVGDAQVPFAVTDSNGTRTDSTATVTVAEPGAPAVDTITGTTGHNTPATFNPLDGVTTTDGATVDGDSVRLIDGDGNLVTELETDEGRFVVDTDTGEITFTPADGFVGDATVPFAITDSNGSRTDSTATITVAAPVVDPTLIIDPPSIPGADFVDPEKGVEIAIMQCTPGEDVRFQVAPRDVDDVELFDDTVQADEDGNAAVTVFGMTGEGAVYAGTYDVTVTCGETVLTGEFTVEVIPGAPAPGDRDDNGSHPIGDSGKLAITDGEGVTAAIWAGIAALAAGGALLAIRRIRRNA